MYPIEYLRTYNIDESNLHCFEWMNVDRLVFELIDLVALIDFINTG